MVPLSDPAVTAAAISGFVTVVGVLLSNWYQSKQRELFEKRLEIKDWYSDVETAANRLKTESVLVDADSTLEFSSSRINYSKSSDDITKLKLHIDQLKKLKLRPPDEVRDEDAMSILNELIRRCERPKRGENSINSALDLKDFIYREAVRLEETIKNDREILLTNYQNVVDNPFRP